MAAVNPQAPGARAQQQLAAHLRNPAANAAPAGVDPRRLAVYRDLVFNNVEAFLRRFFPVTCSLYDDAAWQALVRDFLARHRCASPYFLEIAEEFLQFLAQERGAVPGDPPFLHELAHHEWLELVLDVAVEEFPVAGIDPTGDLLAGVPVLSPLVVLTACHWPVHQVHAGFRPEQPLAAPVFLLVYRDRGDHVRFMEVNAAAARLFSLLREQPGLRGEEAVARLARELGQGDAGALVAAAGDLLAGWLARDIVAGTRIG